MKASLKVVAWLLVEATAFATIGPPSARPHLPIGHDGEHALAFALVGLLLGLSYRHHRIRKALLAVIATAGLELLQRVVPGRHATWEDFVVDATTLCVGLTLAALIDYFRSRTRDDAGRGLI